MVRKSPRQRRAPKRFIADDSEDSDSESFDDEQNVFEPLTKDLKKTKTEIRKLVEEVKCCQRQAYESCVTYLSVASSWDHDEIREAVLEFEQTYVDLGMEFKNLEQESNVYGDAMRKVIEDSTVQTDWMKEMTNIKKFEQEKVAGEDASTEFRIHFRDTLRTNKHFKELGFDPWGEDDDMNMEDTDIVAVHAPRSTTCPLTTAEFISPVKASCGHTFEESAIRNYILEKGGTCECPVRGCNHKIEPSELIVDMEMTQVINKVKEEQVGADVDLSVT